LKKIELEEKRRYLNTCEAC